MDGRFALDTSVVIRLMRGDPRTVASVRQAAEVLLPGIVLGELYYGAAKSAKAAANQAMIDRFAISRTILACGHATARVYGELKKQLYADGRPIPENDIWIAALAIENELTLMTHDRHFEHVRGLSVKSPDV